jgi:transketolase
VEQLASLRITPNLSLWRPCDNVETAVAWRAAIEKHDGPTALVFSRQSLAHQQRSEEQLADIARGAYILRDCDGEPDSIVMATGSEVEICVEAVTALQAEGVKVRLVSIPSVDVFESQDAAYQESVLPAAVRKRLAVEAAAADYWYKLVGLDGKVIGMESFGESAPGPVLLEHFGFSVANVVATLKSLG